jgi:hypothetical protein
MRLYLCFLIMDTTPLFKVFLIYCALLQLFKLDVLSNLFLCYVRFNLEDYLPDLLLLPSLTIDWLFRFLSCFIFK